jgi:regulator of protease activity HflC (stomatin/prohibitin superfamily)
MAVAVVAFLASFVAVPAFLGLLRFFGVYDVVNERVAIVYVLFGKVILIVDEPGVVVLWAKMGWRAPLVRWMGTRYVLDMRIDQTYLRSQPVNSEEGAPMGIGIWYEMFISDPVAYLFKNNDPRGSLRANVSNATVRSLSNMKLATLLENRHAMSQAVREEVSPHSQEWGYSVGSVYIRKVHFRDDGMIRQIEAKVVNRLRQVTSAIKQDGANQVSIITSSADREAAIEFAKAAALRPRIVGEALQRVAADPDVAQALFEALETQRLLDGGARITMLPKGGADGPMLASLLATRESGKASGRTEPPPVSRAQ